MTHPLHAQLDRALHEVWELMLTGPLEASDAAPEDAEPGALTASIQLSGTHERALALQCPLKLARRLTEEMLCMEPGEADPSTIQDALGELANILGGHVKAILDQGGTLSMPTVTRAATLQDVLPGSEETFALGFRYQGEPLRVALLTCPT